MSLRNRGLKLGIRMLIADLLIGNSKKKKYSFRIAKKNLSSYNKEIHIFIIISIRFYWHPLIQKERITVITNIEHKNQKQYPHPPPQVPPSTKLVEMQ